MLKLILSFWLVILCNLSAAALAAANFEYLTPQSVAHLRFEYDKANLGYDGTTLNGVCCYDTREVFAKSESKSSFTGNGGFFSGYFKFLATKTGPELLLDSNVVIGQGKQFLNSGQNVVKARGLIGKKTRGRSYKSDRVTNRLENQSKPYAQTLESSIFRSGL